MKYEVFTYRGKGRKPFCSITKDEFKDERTTLLFRQFFKIPNYIPRKQTIQYSLKKGYLRLEGDK